MEPTAVIRNMIQCAALEDISLEQWCALFGAPTETQTLGESFWPGMMALGLQQRGPNGSAALFRLPERFARENAFQPRSEFNQAGNLAFPSVIWALPGLPQHYEMRCVNIMLKRTRSWRVHGSWLETSAPISNGIPAYTGTSSSTDMTESLPDGTTITYYSIPSHQHPRAAATHQHPHATAAPVHSSSSSSASGSSSTGGTTTTNTSTTNSNSSTNRHNTNNNEESEWEVVN